MTVISTAGIIINKLDRVDLWKLPPGRHQDGLGLSLLVSKDGKSRSWTLQGGRGLGGLRKVGLVEARKRRDALLVHAANRPEQPMPSAPVVKKMPTVLERAVEVIATQTAGLTGEKLARAKYDWERSLLHFAKPLHDRLVNTVETQDVVDVLTPIWMTKKPTAKTVRKHLFKLFSTCKADKLVPDNPAAMEDNLEHKLPKQRHQTTHFAAMPHADVAAYVAVLEEKGTLAALALAFTIVTCVRGHQTFAARWCDIDADNVWTAKAKKHLFSRVPLSAHALAILGKVKAFLAQTGERGDSETYIFPGKEDGHLSSYAMLKLLHETHPHFTVHGFRASFRSWGMKYKIDKDTVEYCLHHIEGSRTEQAYMREECLEERREVLEQWAAYLSPPKQRRLRVVA